MPQPDHLTALAITLPEIAKLDKEVRDAFEYLKQEHGVVPNVLRAYSFAPDKLRPFMQMYNDLMLGESELSPLEREMIAVAVSSVNRCYYCLVAHGAAVRELSGDPELGEMLVMNYRVAELPPKQRAMLNFAVKLTEQPYLITEADRALLRQHGLSDRAIWDISAVAAFFNMSNRMASAVDMIPNREYHARARKPRRRHIVRNAKTGR